MSSITATTKQVAAQLDSVKDELDEISKLLTKVNSALPKPVPEINALTVRLTNVSKSLQIISSGLVKASNVDYDKNAYNNAKKLRKVSASLKSAAKNLSDMLDNFQDKAPEISSFAATLKDCADTGDSLVISVNKVLKNTDKKLKNLINLIDNIRDSEMVNAVVNLTTKNGGDLLALLK